MKDLLKEKLPAHLNGLKPHLDENQKANVPVSVPYLLTDDILFDLKDKQFPFILPLGNGSVTYHNEPRYKITVINYEELINSLPQTVTHNVRRPDFILYDSVGNYFIINELSQGQPRSKRSDAKLQMSNAVKILKAIPEINSWIDARPNRLCFFSCRTSFPSTPQGIADAFGLNGKKLPERVEIKFQPITKAGFLAYESDVVILK